MLGSGEGHSAVHLEKRFTETPVDLSNQMLAVPQRRTECERLQERDAHGAAGAHRLPMG